MQDIQERAVEAQSAEPDEPLRPKPEKHETWARVVYLLIGAAAIASVFIKLQFSTDGVCCGDFDGYYHIKWSSLLWEGMKRGVFPPTFQWLPLTTLDPKGYVDHHLLFHILQIPFTWFLELRMAAKVSAVIFSSLAVFSCYWLIVRYRIRYPLCWLIALLACSAPFLYRMNMAKAPPLAIIFMIVGIYLLFEKKYVWLAPLAFVFVWTYSLFVTLLAAAFIWPLVVFWSERRFDGRSVWRTLSAFVYTLAGTVAGFIINPYFPKNVWLFYEHVRIKLTPGDFTTSVGTEWYPYESWYFLGSCIVAFAAMMVGYVAYDWSDRRRAARSLLLMVFSTLLMIASFKSRRFVEYWPPFAVLFAAFSLQPVLEGMRSAFSRMPSDVMNELEPFLDRDPSAHAERERKSRFWEEPLLALWAFVLGVILLLVYSLVRPNTDNTTAQPLSKMTLAIIGGLVLMHLACVVGYAFWRRSVAKGIAIYLLSMITVTMFINVRETASSIDDDQDQHYYEKSLTWIRANVPEGQRIFNTDWDDFPKMFFYDTKHSYVSGLDPTYLLDKDKELSQLYEKITLGKWGEVNGDVPLIIRDRFGARYVFSDNEDIHNSFYDQAKKSGWFEEIYLYSFSREDGHRLTPDDLAYIQQNASPDFKGWVISADGTYAVAGTTADSESGMSVLEDRGFKVEVVDDSTLLFIRDQKGSPQPGNEEGRAAPEDGTDEEGSSQ